MRRHTQFQLTHIPLAPSASTSVMTPPDNSVTLAALSSTWPLSVTLPASTTALLLHVTRQRPVDVQSAPKTDAVLPQRRGSAEPPQLCGGTLPERTDGDTKVPALAV